MVVMFVLPSKQVGMAWYRPVPRCRGHKVER